MKKIVFALALITFLAAVSYASTPKENSADRHPTGIKTTHHILHPVDHFNI